MLRRAKLLGGLSRRAFSSQNRTQDRNCNDAIEPKLKKPIDLDSSYDAVMKDVEMSLLRHKSRQSQNSSPAVYGTGIKEAEEVFLEERNALNELGTEYNVLSDEELNSQEYLELDSETRQYRDRKSPAARFGSKRIGLVVLPDELQQAIQNVIVGMFIKISISIISF
jgi:hypothetical protein